MAPGVCYSRWAGCIFRWWSFLADYWLSCFLSFSSYLDVILNHMFVVNSPVWLWWWLLFFILIHHVFHASLVLISHHLSFLSLASHPPLSLQLITPAIQHASVICTYLIFLRLERKILDSPIWGSHQRMEVKNDIFAHRPCFCYIKLFLHATLLCSHISSLFNWTRRTINMYLFTQVVCVPCVSVCLHLSAAKDLRITKF